MKHAERHVELTPGERSTRLLEVRRVAEMIAALPAAVHDSRNSDLCQQACLEIFFVHVRTMIEFLRVRTSGHSESHFDVEDLQPGSTPAVSRTQQVALQAHWTTATNEVVHLSKKVRGSGSSAAVDVSLGALQQIANDVLTVWDEWAREMSNGLVPPRSAFTFF